MKFTAKENAVMSILAEALGVPSVHEIAQRKRSKPYALLHDATHEMWCIKKLLDAVAYETNAMHLPEMPKIVQQTTALLGNAYASFCEYMREIARFYGFVLLSIAPIFPTSNL